MDALIAKADAIKTLTNNSSKRKTGQPPRKRVKTSHADNTRKGVDAVVQSITARTTLPRSLRNIPSVINDELLLVEEAGKMEVEGELDRTWRVSQGEIVKQVGAEAAKGRKDIVLDGGPYRTRYTRNGRHLAIVGRTGHVATFDWQTGTMHSELQLRETCRDITFLQDHSHYAVAQKKYVFIYDRDGVELHRLKSHIEPTRLEFLPYHWLLASIGNTGYLKYQDTSTGQIVAEHRTKLGACNTIAQNLHTAVLYLGHQNGTVTLWTPNLPHPAVRLLAHLGPVCSLAVDPSTGGRYMTTAGADATVKIWDCRNWKGSIREWTARGGAGVVEWSQRGCLAVASGGTVNVHSHPSIHAPFKGVTPPPLYLTHPTPYRPLTSVQFCPFQDILSIGHARGYSSILVPGAGEPNFDAMEADPFENRKARREREVRSLLDKIQPDMITLDPDFVGSFAPPSKSTDDVPFARLQRMERLRIQGKLGDEDTDNAVSGEESDTGVSADKKKEKDITKREKRKMRGKSKSLKRYLRKQRKNIIDPKIITMRAKLQKEREEQRKAREAGKSVIQDGKQSALDRFKQTSSRQI